jgi:hypothetical protein
MSRDEEYVEIPPDAVLRLSRQLWKLVMAGIVLPVPTALFAFRFLHRIGPEQTPGEVRVGLSLLLASAAAIAWLLISVRCPNCRVRWMRRVFADPRGTRALTQFLNMRACPDCSYGRAT